MPSSLSFLPYSLFSLGLPFFSDLFFSYLDQTLSLSLSYVVSCLTISLHISQSPCLPVSWPDDLDLSIQLHHPCLARPMQLLLSPGLFCAPSEKSLIFIEDFRVHILPVHTLLKSIIVYYCILYLRKHDNFSFTSSGEVGKGDRSGLKHRAWFLGCGRRGRAAHNQIPHPGVFSVRVVSPPWGS